VSSFLRVFRHDYEPAKKHEEAKKNKKREEEEEKKKMMRVAQVPSLGERLAG